MGEGGGLTNAFPLAGGAWLWAERREQGEDAADEMSPCGPWPWEQQRTDDKAVWLGAGGETGLSVPVVLPRGPPSPCQHILGSTSRQIDPKGAAGAKHP